MGWLGIPLMGVIVVQPIIDIKRMANIENTTAPHLVSFGTSTSIL